MIHFYSCFTSNSQNVNEIAIKELCENFLLVDKGIILFKDNVVCLVSAPRVKKWTIRSPKICRVLESSRSTCLSLSVEVMYIYFSGPYTSHNLYQFSLFQNLARGNFFGVWQRTIDCSCRELDYRVHEHTSEASVHRECHCIAIQIHTTCHRDHKKFP